MKQRYTYHRMGGAPFDKITALQILRQELADTLIRKSSLGEICFQLFGEGILGRNVFIRATLSKDGRQIETLKNLSDINDSPDWDSGSSTWSVKRIEIHPKAGEMSEELALYWAAGAMEKQKRAFAKQAFPAMVLLFFAGFFAGALVF